METATENDYRNLRPTSRIPPEESSDIYPGLCVHDDRVGGSITVSQSRLPLWAFAGVAVQSGWDDVVKAWGNIETDYHWTRHDMGYFLCNLTAPRGEFGRLLLTLADVEREAGSTDSDVSWYERPEMRQRVRKQLERCSHVLDRMDETRDAQTLPNPQG